MSDKLQHSLRGYFDYAAATPLDEDVLEVMQPYFSEDFFNPSGLYLSAQKVRKDIETARERIANVLAVKPNNIVFTAGGTEANNLAIRGVQAKYPNANIVVSAIEHESVLAPAKTADYKIATVDKNGVVDIVSLKKLIDDDTVLVSVMYANNEIGTVEPLRDIATMIGEIKKNRALHNNNLPLLLHTDACQAANYLDLHASRLGVDLMTLNGGKIYGPKQSGALYVGSSVALEPQILGGGQENGLRSGTENVASVIGFSYALQKAQELRKEETMRLEKLRDKLQTNLANNAGVTFNGLAKKRLPNNLNISVKKQDNERLLMELDERGFQVATGSACSLFNDGGSHVLSAIGLSPAQVNSSLRITMGRHTNDSDVAALAKNLLRLLNDFDR